MLFASVRRTRVSGRSDESRSQLHSAIPRDKIPRDEISRQRESKRERNDENLAEAEFRARAVDVIYYHGTDRSRR